MKNIYILNLTFTFVDDIADDWSVLKKKHSSFSYNKLVRSLDVNYVQKGMVT